MSARRLLALAAPLLALALAAPAGARTYFANIFHDLPDANLDDGACDVDLFLPGLQCSLRAAVQTANRELDLGGPGDTLESDEVVLDAGTYALTIQGAGEDEAATGDLDVLPSGVPGIESRLEVRAGNNVNEALVVIDAQKIKDRVFDVRPGAHFTLRRLTVANGRTPKDDFDPGSESELSGGCIRSAGRLDTGSVFFYRCTSLDDGGCISSLDGLATIRNTLLSTCRAKNEGGAIEALDELQVTDTTIGACRAGLGGAIVARAGLALENSTLDRNRAKVAGGVATFGPGAVSVLSATLSENGDANLDASGSTGSVDVANTILWGSRTDCRGTLVSGGGNLEGGSSCGFTGPADKAGVVDAGLLPLNDFGGTVPSRALLPGSPALDFGNRESCPIVDVRNRCRVASTCDNLDPDPANHCDEESEPLCDSGAYEFKGYVPVTGISCPDPDPAP